jgi:hypothetical protein
MDDASRRIASSHGMRKVFLAIFSFSACFFSLRALTGVYLDLFKSNLVCQLHLFVIFA